jgi:hypothetical protein
MRLLTLRVIKDFITAPRRTENINGYCEKSRKSHEMLVTKNIHIHTKYQKQSPVLFVLTNSTENICPEYKMTLNKASKNFPGYIEKPFSCRSNDQTKN